MCFALQVFSPVIFFMSVSSFDVLNRKITCKSEISRVLNQLPQFPQVLPHNFNTYNKLKLASY